MHSILIVEDERIVAKDLQQTLAGMGYDAFAIASSAEEALSRASERCPDLVLMDIRIKGKRDGIETAALLHERFGAPIVYLTAHADEATLDRAKRTEPYGYLMKPVRSAELRSVVEISIYKHQMDLRQRERDRTPPAVMDAKKTGAIVVFRDVPAQPRGPSQPALADRLASLETLAAGLAHEVNNPLAIVLANASYVLEQLRDQQRLGRPDPGWLGETIDAQSDLETAASRIGRIVAELQAFSRPAQPILGETEVGPAVEAAARATAHEFRDCATVAINTAAVPRAKIDELRLGQILVNLLVNAAHATQHGAVASVSVAARVQDDTVVIEVRDSGCGIAPEILPRIFEPFYTTKAIGQGAGLGLAVCHGLVRAAGGRIEVESQLGLGSLFRVTLPAAVRAEPPADAAPPTAAIARRGRFLVVDDEPMILKGIERMLRDHEVVCLDDARQVIGLLDRGEKFDVIFSDLMMPNMTGMELYERLLSGHPSDAHRIVFVTGGAASGRVADFLSVVPNTCLQKPMSRDALRAFVQQRLADP